MSVIQIGLPPIDTGSTPAGSTGTNRSSHRYGFLGAGEFDFSALSFVSHVKTRQNPLNFMTVVTYTLSRLFTRLTGKAVADRVRSTVIDVIGVTAGCLNMWSRSQGFGYLRLWLDVGA